MSYTDLSDDTWQRLEAVLPVEGSPKGGRPANDARTFINAVIWILRTGAPWRALPDEYGSWNSVYSRFRRWQSKGYWAAIFLALSHDSDLETVMIDGTYIHAHKHAAGAKGGSNFKRWAAVAEALPPSCTRRWTRLATLWIFVLQAASAPT
jgi:transposase